MWLTWERAHLSQRTGDARMKTPLELVSYFIGLESNEICLDIIG